MTPQAPRRVAGGAAAVPAEGVKSPYTLAPAEFGPVAVEACERSRRPVCLDAAPGSRGAPA